MIYDEENELRLINFYFFTRKVAKENNTKLRNYWREKKLEINKKN